MKADDCYATALLDTDKVEIDNAAKREALKKFFGLFLPLEDCHSETAVQLRVTAFQIDL